ncbi:MAG: arsenate reductase ArsC [Alphaproteobacteria bacterium]|jgi:protein-tyrosine-phosphatase|nr:arsenate reductase ArsC [Alphaproteobacteria bacterium]
MDDNYTFLFLCTGNSCRSIIAESILNKIGRGKFIAFSAGSKPVGYINPMTIKLLESKGHDISLLSSKNWDQFSSEPSMDFIITVCDNAAGEVCPIWPGRPISAHWGLADPASVNGDEDIRYKAFLDTYTILERRLNKVIDVLSVNMKDKIKREALENALSST